MENKNKKEDPRGMVIGGGLMLGIGVGFFLLQTSALFFVGSIMAGLGLGLLISGFVPKNK